MMKNMLENIIDVDEFSMNPDGAFFAAVEKNYRARQAERARLEVLRQRRVERKQAMKRQLMEGFAALIAAVGLFALAAILGGSV